MIEGVNEFPNRYNPPRAILILALMTLSVCNVGMFFRMDTYQLLDTNFKIKFNIGTKESVQLYSFYFVSSFPLTLLGGFIIGKFGAVNFLNILKIILYLSSLIAIYASFKVNFSLIRVAMALQGFGTEICDATTKMIVSFWFKGRFVGFATALLQFFNSLGESSGDLFTYKLLQKFRDIDLVFVFCSCLSFFDCLMTVIFQIFEIKRVNYNASVKEKDGNEEENTELKLKTFKQLNNKQIWSIVILTFLSENLYFNLISFTNEMLLIRFKFTSLQASNYMPLLPISACIAAFLSGILTVRNGKKIRVILSAHLMVILAYVGLYISPYEGDYNVGIYLSMIGAFFGIVTTMNWGSLALVIPSSAVPLGFGLTIFFRNASAAIFSYISGEIAEDEKKESFQLLILLLLFWAILSLSVAIFAFFQDQRRGGILSRPESSEISLGIKKIIDYRGNKRQDILDFLKFAEDTRGDS